MFDVSAPELITILIIALVVFGPSRLPELAQRIGKWTSELRKAAREVRSGLEEEVRALKEPAEEIKEDIEKPLRDTAAGLREIGEELKSDISWTGPEPDSGPTPADARRDLSEIEETGQPAADPDDPEGEG